jgi:tRNA splicing endonuclease
MEPEPSCPLLPSLSLHSLPSCPPLSPPSISFGTPVTVYHVGDRYLLWDIDHIARLRSFGKMAVTAIGSCSTKTATRGKAAALPVMLSDEETCALIGAGWARVVDAVGNDIANPMAPLLAATAEPSGNFRACRRLVFRDLWTRGYLLTNGIKFGCDYLCYRADPTAVHAAFMVVVEQEGNGIRPLSLTAVARVATTALKIAVVAWADSRAGTVRYAAFKRMGPGTAIFKDSNAEEHVLDEEKRSSELAGEPLL